VETNARQETIIMQLDRSNPNQEVWRFVDMPSCNQKHAAYYTHSFVAYDSSGMTYDLFDRVGENLDVCSG
jgi:hypothetical protein